MLSRWLLIVLLISTCGPVFGGSPQREGPDRTTKERDEMLLATSGVGTQSMEPNENYLRSRQTAVSVNELQAPEKARKALRKALAEGRQDENAKAALDLEKAIALYPHYATALGFRSMLERSTDLEHALQDAEKSVEYDPGSVLGYLALGSAYNGLHRFDDAVRALDYAISINPDAWMAHYEMTRVFIGKHDYTDALKDFEKTRSLATEDYPFMHLMKAAILLGLHDKANAVVELKTYIKEAPNGQKSQEARSTLEKLSPTSGAR